MTDLVINILDYTGGFLWHLSPTILGVLLGGYIIQRYWIKKANESVFIDYITGELAKLVDDTLEYWSLDCSGNGDGVKSRRFEAKKLEQKIKGTTRNLSVVLNTFKKKYSCDVDFTSLMSDVMEACTGGEFESKKRKPDPRRYLSVVNSIHRVRSELFERRV